MNTGRPSCCGNVRAIIDQQARRAAAGELHGLPGQLKKNATADSLFADLNEIDSGRNRRRYQIQD